MAESIETKMLNLRAAQVVAETTFQADVAVARDAMVLALDAFHDKARRWLAEPFRSELAADAQSAWQALVSARGDLNTAISAARTKCNTALMTAWTAATTEAPLP